MAGLTQMNILFAKTMVFGNIENCIFLMFLHLLIFEPWHCVEKNQQSRNANATKWYITLHALTQKQRRFDRRLRRLINPIIISFLPFILSNITPCTGVELNYQIQHTHMSKFGINPNSKYIPKFWIFDAPVFVDIE